MTGGMPTWLWWLVFTGSLVICVPACFLALSLFELGWGWWRK